MIPGPPLSSLAADSSPPPDLIPHLAQIAASLASLQDTGPLPEQVVLDKFVKVLEKRRREEHLAAEASEVAAVEFALTTGAAKALGKRGVQG